MVWDFFLGRIKRGRGTGVLTSRDYKQYRYSYKIPTMRSSFVRFYKSIVVITIIIFLLMVNKTVDDVRLTVTVVNYLQK